MCVELCIQYYNDPTTSSSTVSYKKEMILPDALICLSFDEKELDEERNIHPTTPNSPLCSGYGKCDGSPAPQSNSGNGYGYGYQNGPLPETNAKISTPGDVMGTTTKPLMQYQDTVRVQLYDSTLTVKNTTDGFDEQLTSRLDQEYLEYKPEKKTDKPQGFYGQAFVPLFAVAASAVVPQGDGVRSSGPLSRCDIGPWLMRRVEHRPARREGLSPACSQHSCYQFPDPRRDEQLGWVRGRPQRESNPRPRD
uniref:Uncharacterized protein n=1 Tax=Plectus sambesii TaxID=2011161 RepID=A0A914VUD3_9BILA